MASLVGNVVAWVAWSGGWSPVPGILMNVACEIESDLVVFQLYLVPVVARLLGLQREARARFRIVRTAVVIRVEKKPSPTFRRLCRQTFQTLLSARWCRQSVSLGFLRSFLMT